jgi:hypothetical protein
LKRKDKKTHITEQKYPKQCEEYRKIQHQLYQLHLDKNREYSPNNVRALGILGLALRVHEKSIRLLNLLGWDPFEGKPTPGITDPKFGSIEAELEDIANIPILALIMARNNWGK